MTAAIVAKFWPSGEFPSGSSSTLDVCTGLSFLADLRSPGQGRVVQMNDATNPIESGGVVTFDVQGTRAFAALSKRRKRTTVDPNGESGQRTTWDMPGHLAILKDGLIQPPGGTGRDPVVDTRYFNWVDPSYDDSGWGTATNIAGYDVADAQASWPITYQQPWGDVVRWAEDMPGSGTQLVGPSSGTSTSAPSGDYYLRDTFTAPSDLAYILFVTADNMAEVFIDGKAIVSCGGAESTNTSGFANVTREAVSLSAGTHTIAIKVTNTPPAGGPNPTAVAASVWIPGYPPTVVWDTSTAMKILEYPAEEPGMTVGQALILALEEAQAEGSFPDVTWDFDETDDSDGTPWDFEANITATVGRDTVLDFVTKLQAAYADIVMDPSSFVLHAYVWGDLNPASGVTFTAANLTSLVHDTEAVIASKLLILSAAGWTEYGTGAVQGFLELGQEITEEEIVRIGDSVLDIYADVRVSVQATYVPDPSASPSEVPWVNTNYVPGADLTVPDVDGSPLTERVMSLGCSISETAEELQVEVVVKDRIQDFAERMVQELKS